MDATTQPALQPESADALSAWESWVDSAFAWMPYVTLGVSLLLAQVGTQEMSDRLLTTALAAVAAAWTWLMFTRKGLPRHGLSRP